jgi:hypothetical protein
VFSAIHVYDNTHRLQTLQLQQELALQQREGLPQQRVGELPLVDHRLGQEEDHSQDLEVHKLVQLFVALPNSLESISSVYIYPAKD